MEILKQGQYHPIPVWHQVEIIYAATNNYLADIPVDKIKDFEQEFYQFMIPFLYAIPGCSENCIIWLRQVSIVRTALQ